jgi:transposase
LPTAASHPFYRRLNLLLPEHGFDDFAEAQSATFYAETMGRPSLSPGIYFRLLLIGYFEAIDCERGIAWRAADSLALRELSGRRSGRHPTRSLDDFPHASADRSRNPSGRLYMGATVPEYAGLVKGKTIGIDATTLEANAALRSIVRRGRATRGGRPHLYETGGLRRMHVRGHVNVRKRLLVQAGACNLGCGCGHSSVSARRATGRSSGVLYAESPLCADAVAILKCVFSRGLIGYGRIDGRPASNAAVALA